MGQQPISKPRGTVDFIAGDCFRYLECVDILKGIALEYGCQPVQTPAFEETGLFLRSVGASSDIVRKETFDLANKGSSKDYTLRPEFTAGVVRMVIENKLFASPDTPLRYCYWGPVYRYERPGTGRLREFRQFGVEFFDKSLDFNAQAETIDMAYRGATAILKRPLGVTLNYLGGSEARAKYRQALVDYFNQFISGMCEDCQARIKLNPLRILDCKVEADQKLVAGAPKIEDYLTEADKAEFEAVKGVLSGMGVPYRIDDRLVRGLDYYTGTVFEIEDVNNPQVGALGGGGKYAGLMASLGGPDLEGMGFSYGVDRLLLAAGDAFQAKVLVPDALAIACAKNPQCEAKTALVAERLRAKGLSVVVPTLSKSVGGCFKMADRLHCRYAVLVNEDLTLEVKNLADRTQEKVEESSLAEKLKGNH